MRKVKMTITVDVIVALDDHKRLEPHLTPYASVRKSILAQLRGITNPEREDSGLTYIRKLGFNLTR